MSDSNNTKKGKGLDDLLNRPGPLNRAARVSNILDSVASTRALEGALVVKLTQLAPNFLQVRQHFDEEALAELGEDIKVHGILEPLIVRETEPGTYEIIAGERRYRAAQQVGLTEVPVIVRQMDDRAARFAMLAENIQRQDLDPRDEQRFFQTLQAEYNLSVRDIAKLISKSKGYVENRLEGKLQEMQKRPSQGQKLQISHSDGAIKPPLKYNPVLFKRVSQFFDNTLEVVKSKPDKSTVEQIRVSIEETEQKLAELKKELEGLE